MSRYVTKWRTWRISKMDVDTLHIWFDWMMHVTCLIFGSSWAYPSRAELVSLKVGSEFQLTRLAGKINVWQIVSGVPTWLRSVRSVTIVSISTILITNRTTPFAETATGRGFLPSSSHLARTDEICPPPYDDVGHLPSPSCCVRLWDNATMQRQNNMKRARVYCTRYAHLFSFF